MNGTPKNKFKRNALSEKMTTASAFFLLVSVLMAPMADAAVARPEDTMWSKAGRGMGNILFGWVEILRQPAVMHQEEGERWPIAILGGTLRGVGYAVARTGVGVYEVLTFPFPCKNGYAPIIEPEFVIPETVSSSN